ncbi:hypothetical protein J4450_01465 [Candidatus Micrarchaeota archaeon]|nr:hypothetical protein [Candidatus Micrarchaeota archaeon]
MQTLEAIISLLFLVSFVSFVASEQHARGVDDSLYKYQLANDVWRVVYLRNGIDSNKYENDIKRIGELTNLCIFIDDVTNCDEEVEEIISTERIVVVGNEPKKVMVTIAKKKH